ncbi:MAG: GTP cyclohydrolase II [Moraxellaceae bacterium]|nr:GTP cyclohydrolase II [Pseudomonadales bacterium]MCB1673215.1 GTP cyclohydrolase II [Pseudomonadales bacterium]MCP5175230.1 GTP cyclohydrolase II [Moraxellaceae bacterium]MCP5177071.1 GTP cyclohydrolase II [Moraxellaceae bacterium]
MCVQPQRVCCVSIVFIASSKLPTKHGDFLIHAFEESDSGQEHIALTMGNIADGQPVLARIHSECLTGDGFGSLRCDCGPQLEAAMQKVAQAQRGVILYLRQEGRGIGLVNKVRAYALQDAGADTVEANEQLGFAPDLREYSMCEVMLAHLGVKQVRLMTNNPLKVAALEKHHIDVVERVPLMTGRNPHNDQYLDTKEEKMGHLF